MMMLGNRAIAMPGMVGHCELPAIHQLPSRHDEVALHLRTDHIAFFALSDY